ncbi:class I SAM-dependent methyltransferase [Dactylosporangium sp. NPDC000521]|uniref:class I SAM-dependent methyltransferase n=1 Tax=Dactylosporangium sp. NPDC000521 TaxID=3363975 RepID=UPI00368E6800
MAFEQDRTQTHAGWSQDHTEIYDLVFRSRGKSFEAEADDIAAHVRARHPGATTLLDVASGTGAHLVRYAEVFEHVEGVELAPAMRVVAQRKLPGVAVHAGDMRDFDLGRTFDAVVCLGNSVACMASTAELDTAIARMAAHLEPGGVLIVEPGWFPEQFLDGYVGGHLVREPGRVISRVTHSTRDGLATRVEIRFTVATSEGGIREWTDYFYMNLFTREEYTAAFEKAGCAVEFLDIPWRLGTDPHNAPGLFAGVRK